MVLRISGKRIGMRPVRHLPKTLGASGTFAGTCHATDSALVELAS